MKFTLVVFDGCNGPCHRGVVEPEVRKLDGYCTALHDGTLYRANNGVLLDTVEGMNLLVPHGTLAELPETGTEFTEEEAAQEYRELYGDEENPYEAVEGSEEEDDVEED